jgi:hypothetical protein
LIAAQGAFAALGDVINSFVARRPGEWQGAACYANGYVWDCGRNSSTLYKRDPVTGADVPGSISMPSAEVGGVAWDTSHGTWWITEPWDEYQSADVLELPAGGGTPITRLEPGLCGDCGICYDPEFDELWVADNCYSGKIVRITKTGTRTFNVSDPESMDRPVAVCRVGNYLWLGNMIGGSYGRVQQYTFDATTLHYTGVNFSLPNSRIPGLDVPVLSNRGIHGAMQENTLEPTTLTPLIVQSGTIDVSTRR